MTQRTVTGTIKKPDGTVYSGVILTFILKDNIISSSIFIPKTSIQITTASDGTFIVNLYVPDSGTAQYELVSSVGEYQQPFNLGSGSSIDLSEILSIPTVAADPNYITELTSLNITYTAVDLQITSAHEYVWSDGTVTITLPATTGKGDVYFLEATSTGSITPAVTGSDTINGTTPLVIPANTIAYYVDAEVGNWHSNW
jgi:hypothetical protein